MRPGIFGRSGVWGTLDQIPPVINVSGSSETLMLLGEALPEFTYSAIDNQGIDITSDVVVTADAADINVEGRYNTLFEVSDILGIEATPVNRLVIYSQDDGQPVFNPVVMDIYVENGPLSEPDINTSLGNLFRLRRGKLIISFDEGSTDASIYSQIKFGIFPIGIGDALVSKELESGIEVVDGKLEISISAVELDFSGKHYFEVFVASTTSANLISGYLNVVDTRIN